MTEEFRLTPFDPDEPKPAKKPERRTPSARQLEATLAALSGLTVATCPDPRERAMRIARELAERLAAQGYTDEDLDNPYCSLTVRQMGDAATVTFVEREGVRVGVLTGGDKRLPNRLTVVVGHKQEKPARRFLEPNCGFDFDRILRAVAARSLERTEVIERAMVLGVAEHMVETLAAKYRTAVEDEGGVIGPAVSGVEPVYRVCFDLASGEELYALAQSVGRIRRRSKLRRKTRGRKGGK